MKKKQTKTAFVLSFPVTTPAKDIEAAAKKKGIKLSAHYAHVIRSNAKRKMGKPIKRRMTRLVLADEKDLRFTMVNVGLERSRQILEALNEEFR